MMDGERDGTHQNEIQELKFKKVKGHTSDIYRHSTLFVLDVRNNLYQRFMNVCVFARMCACIAIDTFYLGFLPL